jgi:tRNA(adenine34) deaminase
MDHEFYMQQALSLAADARAHGEVPIGAVLVLDGVIIAEAYNQPISLNDPSAHAEILALRSAGKALGNYRLLNTTLYVTLEPCAMCAAAMVHARIAKVIFATSDPKSGVVCSHLNFFEQPFLNHRVGWEGDCLQQEAAQLLTDFFKEKRNR